MEPGPLPPHERAWRHPSELGPPADEPTSTSGRLLIVSTAALGLLLVGVLAVIVTPPRDAGEEVAPLAGSAAPAAAGLVAPPAIPFAVPGRPVVVPVLAAGVGLTTQAGVGRAFRRDGATIDAVVMAVVDEHGVVVVSIPVVAAGDVYQVTPAAVELVPSDTVMVLGDEPAVLSVAALAELAVADGTPVTDATGRLIGLCRRDTATRQTSIVVTDEPLVAAIDGSD